MNNAIQWAIDGNLRIYRKCECTNHTFQRVAIHNRMFFIIVIFSNQLVELMSDLDPVYMEWGTPV